jgi:hypothetical protein
VQPQHERRKYLAGERLFKFAGLGRFGRAKFELARELASAGWSPRAVALDDGFIEFSFVRGRPLQPGDADQPLLDRMAAYLRWRAGHLRTAGRLEFEPLLEMIRVNAGREIDFETWRGLLSDQPAVAVDGRMLPHEWLATSGGFLKTDSTDHHDDHFFPGCADIAWDVAGASVEFDLDEPQKDRLVAGLRDATLARRLPFYTAAYLSFRLGYAEMAGDADGGRFQALARRYRARLAAALATAARPCR